MQRITQETIDDLIPVANRLIQEHNKLHPEARLLLFPKTKRIVRVRDPAELEQEEDHIRNVAAAYYFSSGTIDMNPAILTEQVEVHAAAIDGAYRPTGSVPSIRDLTLLHVLLHEDLHRSSKRVILDDPYASTYRGVATHACQIGNQTEQKEFINNKDCRVITSGLRIIFEVPSLGKELGPGDDLDEVVAHWLDAHFVGEQLAGLGCFKTPQHAAAALLASKSFMDREAFNASLAHMERRAGQYSSLMGQYLASDIPVIVAREAMTKRLATYRARAVFATAMGWVAFLPEVMRTVYGPAPTPHSTL
ncbi:hypothetical protein HYS47_05590 [Candidatus Woesearchaeota archaeon]|nr:hypothetical protein [Candidatus Woesearchaeota archaeon]